ncbi:hypothetical protein KEM48_014653 [Puccinia striiformis f. sp. tritici PST-130]|nr:hypothetical protein H4Q26_011054 [Puccinia striiformis f. sp. tritici PST-130]KAI9631650.1 hypothetical protein KEM48_014653 [Puccinia striiformis f. sp. tritici PST-130]
MSLSESGFDSPSLPTRNLASHEHPLSLSSPDDPTKPRLLDRTSLQSIVNYFPPSSEAHATPATSSRYRTERSGIFFHSIKASATISRLH